ncbi:MAG TPA: hypothetical protein VFO89_16795 [Thermoanaerobaculia bacterium]|nr:hypothetical protein [Thermoanaerobaculia bacterium]
MTETTPPVDDPVLEAMHRHALAYVAERDQNFLAQPGRRYAPGELDWILGRLSYWSGVFSTYLDEAVERERQQELGFPLYFLKLQYEIVSLKLDLMERKLSAAHAAPAVPAPAPAPAPAAPAPAPAAPKMTPQQEVELYERRIREEVRTAQNKSVDLLQMKRNWALNGREFAVVGDFGPSKCGAIHPSCGHDITGRCDLKMAHSVVSNEALHHCRQCGQKFTR